MSKAFVSGGESDTNNDEGKEEGAGVYWEGQAKERRGEFGIAVYELMTVTSDHPLVTLRWSFRDLAANNGKRGERIVRKICDCGLTCEWRFTILLNEIEIDRDTRYDDYAKKMHAKASCGLSLKVRDKVRADVDFSRVVSHASLFNQ
ncbi:hypothetical protein Tco_0218023 [Tanacetum coccineum]|uniref:Transposase MuDR plant domain-containing protein n=1 Tax=Tanacetum coccineum TaxID=301880 RepID=A0ABQ5GGV8_9ASTR